jgi:hypothetical protein
MGNIAVNDTVSYGPFRFCIVVRKYDDGSLEIMTENETLLHVHMNDCEP